MCTVVYSNSDENIELPVGPTKTTLTRMRKLSNFIVHENVGADNNQYYLET